MSGDLRVAVEAVQNARRAAGSGMRGVAEEMADKLDACAGAYDGIDGWPVAVSATGCKPDDLGGQRRSGRPTHR